MKGFLIGLSLFPLSLFALANHPYHFDLLELSKAHQITTGSKDVKVSIISTGIPDIGVLHGNLDRNLLEVPDNGLDDDGNGYVDDVLGVNTLTGESDPSPKGSFSDAGTASAAILGARPLFGDPDVALLKDVSIIAVNSFDEMGSSDVVSVIKAAGYAISRGARIISFELGHMGEKVQSYCTLMDENKNVLFVAAAGNDGKNLDESDNIIYPAQCARRSNLLVVAASGKEDELSFFTNYGRSVEVAAPGQDILTYNDRQLLTELHGTSFASAIASGVAALALSANQTLSAEELKHVIVSSVDKIPSFEGKIGSGGRVNAAKAVQAAVNYQR
ncbi:MAG TPA: S8 family serine peptidase [Bdellovibrionota bacterium]|nr:S8 family serine peptidase [Bdellovibrionota bacterium]